MFEQNSAAVQLETPEHKSVQLDATNLDYRQLNMEIRHSVESGAEDVAVQNVCGQRYIADALDSQVHLNVYGTPGQNLGAFMRGPHVRVEGNAQDGVGNTMDDGEIQINGHAGDVLGYAMRGGRILVRGDVGYRVGIHMKAYADHVPSIVIGGKAGSFLGEYMAGGVIVLLGLDSQYPDAPLAGSYLGTGMHGGRIFVRGEFAASSQASVRTLHVAPLESEEDHKILEHEVQLWAEAFGYNAEEILHDPFICIHPEK